MAYSVNVDGDLCECRLTPDGVSFTSKSTSVQIKTEDIIGSDVVSMYRLFSGSALDFWFIKQDGDKLTKSKVQISGDQNVWEELKKIYKIPLINVYQGKVAKPGSVRNQHNTVFFPKIVTKRPKSLLVLINPIGGDKTGVNDYQKILAPIFKLARIKCDVNVSERKKHMVDIVSSYDFTDIDGIVVLGGDGSYSEVVNVLLRETQDKTGIDCNDPSKQLQQVQIPIAMIPTGSGNCVAGSCTGCKDILNSTLHVIKGNVSLINMLGAYADGKLINYAGIGFAYGSFADTLHYSDTKFRWLGRIRYYACMLWQRLFQSFRTFKAEITFYGKVSETEETATQNEGEKEVLIEGRKLQGVKTYTDDSVVFEGLFKCIMSIDGNLLNDDKKGHDWVHTFKTPGHVFSSVMFNERMSVPDSMKIFRDIISQSEDSGDDDFLFNVNAREIKIRVNDYTKSQGTELEMLKHIILIDGEIHSIDKLEIQIMLHQKVVPVFTSYL